MTESEQNQAIAEWCGVQTDFTSNPSDYVPNYTGDLNAMASAELKLDGRLEYYDTLKWICDHDWQHASVKMPRNPIQATAAQRAEALLKTLHLWKD